MQGRFMRCCSIARNQIGHRLRLCEIELTIQKSSLRELSGLCQPRSFLNTNLDDLLQYKWRTMTADLNHIFTRIRSWIFEKRNNNLIEDFFLILNKTDVQTMRRLDREVFRR